MIYRYIYRDESCFRGLTSIVNLYDVDYRWFRRVDVINRGFSGYNTKWGLMVIDAVINEAPDIVFICFGANDAIDMKIAQHVTLDNYKKNLKDMITVITKVIAFHHYACYIIIYLLKHLIQLLF